MADRIKGISVEIGGDTTGLSNALKGVNKEISSTQSQLKDVEKLLKLDPKNTTLLEQKQRLLAEAVEGTKTKLETLKQAENQAQDQFKRGEISQQQYEALQREIIETEQKLKSLETAAAQSNSTLASVKESADKIATGAGNVSKATAPLTAGIAAVGAAAVVAMDRVDEGLDTVMLKTGATGDTAKELQGVYEDLATRIPGEFADIGAAVGEVNTRFQLTGDALGDMSEEFLKFAKVNETDVSTSIGTVDKIMEAWNVDLSQTGDLLGMLTKKGQDTGISVDTLMNTVLENNSTFKEMGLSLEESINLMAQFEATGVNSSTAMTGLKKAVANATAEGLSLDEALAQTIDSIKNASSETEALELATELFGTKGAAEMTNAIREGRFSLDDISDSLSNYGAVVDDTYGMVVDEVDDAQLAMQTLQVAAHGLGETLAKTLGPILLDLAQKVQGVLDWFGNLDGTTQAVILTVIALVAAISPIAGLISAIATVVGTVTGAIAIFTGAATTGTAAATALAGAMTFITGPVGIVIGIIAAVVAAVVLLWNRCEGFRTAVTTIWEMIKGAFQSFVDWLQGIFGPIWESAFGAFQTIFQAFHDAAAAIWDAITGVFQMFGTWLNETFGVTWNDVFAAMGVIMEGFKTALSLAWEVIKGVFTTFSDFLTTVFRSSWTGAFDNLKATAEALRDNITQVWEGIKTTFQGVMDFITGVFTGDWTKAWEGIKAIFKGVFDSLVGIVKVPINGIIGLLNNAISAVNSLIAGINKVIAGLNALGLGIPSIPTIPNIAYLAKGGILESGQAVVGENGPELLSLMDGKAKVTPLTSNEGDGGTRDTTAGAAGYNQTLNFYGDTPSPAEVARRTRNATRRMLSGVKA